MGPGAHASCRSNRCTPERNDVVLLRALDVVLAPHLGDVVDAIDAGKHLDVGADFGVLILRIAVAELVHPPDPVLGFRVAAFGQRAIFVGGGDVILLAQCLVAFFEAGDGGVRAG